MSQNQAEGEPLTAEQKSLRAIIIGTMIFFGVPLLGVLGFITYAAVSGT